MWDIPFHSRAIPAIPCDDPGFVYHGSDDVDVQRTWRKFGWTSIALGNGQSACQPNNRCLWCDQSLIPGDTKFPDFQAARRIWTVDGTRKWWAGEDWFYDFKERDA